MPLYIIMNAVSFCKWADRYTLNKLCTVYKLGVKYILIWVCFFKYRGLFWNDVFTKK